MEGKDFIVCHDCGTTKLGVVTNILPESYPKQSSKEIGMLPDKLCEEGEHEWSIFKISHVSKPDEFDFKERETSSIPNDVSICDKCGMVCYNHKTIGLVNALPFMFVDEEKYAELVEDK